MHHSMVRLPAVPMRPRIEDARVGFFDVSFEDYGTPEQRVKDVHYITRWRLEKKDPAAALNNPNDPFADVNKEATAIGLSACAAGSGDSGSSSS